MAKGPPEKGQWILDETSKKYWLLDKQTLEQDGKLDKRMSLVVGDFKDNNLDEHFSGSDLDDRDNGDSFEEEFKAE